MIKVIAFDFGGVLGPDANDWNNTFKPTFLDLIKTKNTKGNRNGNGKK